MLAYSDGVYWFDWLKDQPVLSLAWSIALVLSFVLWLWATAAFGLRWSNLTHRGIITNGPYRFTKHPDYIAKSLFFWLISMPFLSSAGPVEALKNCLLLGLINAIYLLRARAEERHLSADPDYAAYALAMNERGIFKPLATVFPALRFQARPA
nr:isoprenylcysteine carboxylmethyltransferase family protein [Pelagibacterium xiamenense]